MKIENFSDLQLSDQLLRAIDEAGYETPTPIQARAIPAVLNRSDLLGIAQTGTGKTAAFTLPLLQNLVADDPESRRARTPRALILAPTRELALQISDNLKTYSRHLKIRHSVVMGGVGQGRQVEALRRGVDILIATPGRLLDLVQQGHVDFSQCRYLVLDEADRMLDMGFIRDIRKIVATLPSKRQNMLFSATMPAEILRLASDILVDPKRIEVSPPQLAVEKIDQRLIHVETTKKRDLLGKMLNAPEFQRVIIFTRTKHRANRLVRNLEADGISAVALHGNKSQSARQRALKEFTDGTSRILVATDIASRGIDVPMVSHVINYELPEVPESYMHRIGRTARAGECGIAISFCDSPDRDNLRAIERFTRQTIPLMEGYDGFVDRNPTAIDKGKPAGNSHRHGKPQRAGKRPRRRRSNKRLAA